ncbi:hypothetical protein ACHAXT_008953 [Thalassiosira profunda]
MFSRYRRSASAPHSAPSSLGAEEDAAAAARASLEELRRALDRLDFLTIKLAERGDDDSGAAKGVKKASPAKSPVAKAAKSAPTKEKEGDAAIIGDAEHDGAATTKIVAVKAGEADNAENDTAKPDDSNNSPAKQIERSPSATAADVRAAANADFLAVDRSDELELVELLRRIAELAVLSERKAGQLLERQGNPMNGRDGEGQAGGEGAGEDEAQKKSAYNEDAALPYLALFELFCERNALATMVNIVTGVAFERAAEGECNNIGVTGEDAPSDDNSLLDAADKPKRKRRAHRLPPLTIATQAVQSVSILIQNVSRATSLYFLLSNNRVNDLIKLPLHLYKRAEMNALHYRYNEKYSKRRGSRHPPPPPGNLANYQSPEMGELTTHFVSFLKSLALRVNAETLQFFLSFPLTEGSGSDGGRESSEVQDDAAGETEVAGEASPEKKPPLSYLERRRVVEFPLYARALEFCAPEQDSFVRVTAMNVCMNLVRLAAVHPGAGCEAEEIEEKEDGEGESATKEGDKDATTAAAEDGEAGECSEGAEDVSVKEEGDEDGDADDATGSVIGEGDEGAASGQPNNDGQGSRDEEVRKQPQRALPTETPKGVLDEAPELPLQDRIAIAQYACNPKRVGDLVSPLCARLTSQFGQVEGTVRALEELNNATMSSPSSPPAKPSPEKSKGRKPPQSKDEERNKLRNSVQDLIANVQDELLLLDDLLKVGLISLNEQAIEMMLATFVYPMLLQPLLLPLHRFSLSKRRSDDDNPQKPTEDKKRPVITPQSPPPFLSRSSSTVSNDEGVSTDGGVSSENDDGGGTTTNDGVDAPAIETAQSATSEASEKPQSYSSRDMDVAPSKTALLGLSVIFHTVSNPTFRHLLLTALLHPYSPEASGGIVISTPPHITLPKRTSDGECCGYDLQLEIRTEENQAQASRESEAFQREVNVYAFGTRPRESEEGEEGDTTLDFANTCVFILAPALVDMLRSNISPSQTESESATTRSNPYRTILLSAIAGTEEMVSLQPLAIAALHAAVSSVDSATAQKIMFVSRSDCDQNGTTAKPNSLDVKDTLRSLCRGIVNLSVTYDGWWKCHFNQIAARTLMDILSENHDDICLVEEIVGGIRLQAAEHLMTLPSHLDNKTREGDPRKNKSTAENQYLESWLLDRFFFDQPDRVTNSVVEHVCYLKEQGGDSKEQYRYGLEVLSSISIAGTSALLCEGTHVVDNMAIAAEEARQSTPFYCATSWALACVYLDAFYMKLTKLSAALEDEMEMESSAERRVSKRKKLSLVATQARSFDDDDSVEEGSALAHISSKFAISLLDEGESSESDAQHDGGSPPEHGSSVGLVGKAAFPCVCEVHPNMASLFTGRTCISNEGIEWQSLYLVVVGKWAVLAEPGHGGTGGEGRVITACRLACLAVKKDASSAVNNKTPARRLLFAHASLDPRPPSLFMVDRTASSRGRGGPNLGPNGLRLTRSRMDLWFEDANAAGHACKVLSAKIAKARAKRGSRIKAALLAK